jgi:hypothetical protein
MPFDCRQSQAFDVAPALRPRDEFGNDALEHLSYRPAEVVTD